MAQILDINLTRKPELLDALQSTFARLYQIKAQGEEVKRRQQAYELDRQQAALGVDREKRLADSTDFQNQLAARQAATQDAERVLPGAPPEMGPPQPDINIPGLSLGGQEIIPQHSMRQRFESELAAKALQQARAQKELAGFVEVTPETHAALPSELQGIFRPGSFLPPTLAAKMVETPKPDAGYSLHENEVRFDANNRPVARGPAKQVAPPVDVEGVAQLLANGTPASDLPKYVKDPATRAAAIKMARDAGSDVFNNPKDKEKVEKLREIERDATRLGELLDDPKVKAAIGPMWGMLAGTNWADIKGRYTNIDPAVREALQLSSSLSDTELRRRSGAAVTEPEFQRVLRFTSDFSRPLEHNALAIKKMREGTSFGIDSILGRRKPAAPGAGGPPPVGPRGKGTPDDPIVLE